MLSYIITEGLVNSTAIFQQSSSRRDSMRSWKSCMNTKVWRGDQCQPASQPVQTISCTKGQSVDTTQSIEVSTLRATDGQTCTMRVPRTYTGLDCAHCLHSSMVMDHVGVRLKMVETFYTNGQWPGSRYIACCKECILSIKSCQVFGSRLQRVL